MSRMRLALGSGLGGWDFAIGLVRRQPFVYTFRSDGREETLNEPY
jgi:hypothetical protein